MVKAKLCPAQLAMESIKKQRTYAVRELWLNTSFGNTFLVSCGAQTRRKKAGDKGEKPEHIFLHFHLNWMPWKNHTELNFEKFSVEKSAIQGEKSQSKFYEVVEAKKHLIKKKPLWTDFSAKKKLKIKTWRSKFISQFWEISVGTQKRKWLKSLKRNWLKLAANS